MLPDFPADATLDSLVYAHLLTGQTHPIWSQTATSLSLTYRLVHTNPFGFHCNAIAERLCGASITGETLLDRHAHFHFITCRTPLWRKPRLRLAMLEGRPDSMRSIGGASRPLVSTYLCSRICPDCVQEDTERFGTAHWRSSHALPFQTHCIHHGTRLIASCSLCDAPVHIEKEASFPSLNCRACGARYREPQGRQTNLADRITSDFVRKLATPTGANLDPDNKESLIRKAVLHMRERGETFTDFVLDLLDAHNCWDLLHKINVRECLPSLQQLLRLGHGRVSFETHVVVAAAADHLLGGAAAA